jgi:hypothetical protein
MSESELCVARRGAVAALARLRAAEQSARNDELLGQLGFIGGCAANSTSAPSGSSPVYKRPVDSLSPDPPIHLHVPVGDEDAGAA